MQTYKKITTTTEPCLVIEYDTDVESPRRNSNLGYFITVDRHYNSPDTNTELQNIVKDAGEIAGSQAEHMEIIKAEILSRMQEKVIAIYPVVKFEHGNVVYSLGTQHGFDCSNNGFYIVTDKTQKELGTPQESFEKVIKQEIETYNNWANDEIYRFTLYDSLGEQIEACGGFYDLEDIREYLPTENYKDENLLDYLID